MNKRIIVVDDDPDLFIAVRKIFENEGNEVFTVDCGMDCLKELERGFRGVILMDVMMPFMGGWDNITEIMKRGYTKDVIIRKMVTI
jgi:CheY-like chemotaxis protein